VYLFSRPIAAITLKLNVNTFEYMRYYEPWDSHVSVAINGIKEKIDCEERN